MRAQSLTQFPHQMNIQDYPTLQSHASPGSSQKKDAGGILSKNYSAKNREQFFYNMQSKMSSSMTGKQMKHVLNFPAASA